MSRTVNIIGAGIAGLSAGSYLQMNGYRTRIFESHNIPGGLCTSWKRNGYVFDGCIDWLVGSGRSNGFYQMWNELIDMDQMQFVEHEESLRIEDANGGHITIFSDIDKLESEMLRVAPEDERVIRKFAKSVRRLSRFKFNMEKAPQTFNLFDKIKFVLSILPFLPDLKYWKDITASEYAARCSNRLLSLAFDSMFVSQLAAIAIIFKRVWMNQKSAGYPIGGSLKFARKIEQKYLELGGEINYGSMVTKINVEDDRAVGVKLSDGKVHDSEITISAADGHYTIYEMLEGKYSNKKIDSYYENAAIFPSYIQVSLGIARRFDNEPHIVMFPLKKPLVIDETRTCDYIRPRIFNYDPTLAPEGKTVITVLILTENYTYWKNLRENDSDKYNAQKDRIARGIIEALEDRFGNIADNVEEVDVSTPSTVIRYTNNWKGSFEGWILSPEIAFKQMDMELPGLENFYMAGQWVQPGGGLPSSLLSGRNVAQIICKKDKVKFTANQQ